MTEINWLKHVQEPKYWLLGIASGLIALHLTVTSRTNDSDLFGTMLMFWGVVAFLIWERHESLTFESGVFNFAQNFVDIWIRLVYQSNAFFVWN
jgi:hypothetical protein